jgi:hypothetical protein
MSEVKAGMTLPPDTSQGVHGALIRELFNNNYDNSRKILAKSSEDFILRDNICPTLKPNVKVPQTIEEMFTQRNLMERGFLDSSHMQRSVQALSSNPRSALLHSSLPPEPVDVSRLVKGKHPKLAQTFLEKIQLPKSSQMPLYMSVLHNHFKDLEDKQKTVFKNDVKTSEPMLPGKSLVAKNLFVYYQAVIKQMYHSWLTAMTMIPKEAFKVDVEMEQKYQTLLSNFQAVTLQCQILQNFQKSVLQTDNSDVEHDKTLLKEFLNWKTDNKFSKTDPLNDQISAAYRPSTKKLRDKKKDSVGKYHKTLESFCNTFSKNFTGPQ